MTTRSSSAELLWKTACWMGATAVMAGAFGSHGLRQRITDPERIKSWQTGAHYQLIHSVAMLASTSMARSGTRHASSWFFLAGNLLFSGSIYVLTLYPQTFRPFGLVTPLGGLSLIAGWVCLAFKR